MMRGRWFFNKTKFGCRIPFILLVFIIKLIINIQGKALMSNVPPSKVSAFKLSGSLRYLSKAVFTKALIGENALIGHSSNELPGGLNLAEAALQSANQEDSSDCTKRLLCELQSKENLSWDEELLKNAVPSEIDYSSPTLQMNLAVALGLNNPQQCEVVFNRCQYDGGEIMNFLRKSGTSIEIDSEDMEYECNVLFLWTRKNKTVDDNVKRRTTDLMDMKSSLG